MEKAEKPSFIFGCTGNVFRSFWAEQVFGSLTLGYTKVSSAGLDASTMKMVDKVALAVLNRAKYSYQGRDREDFFHVPTQFTTDLANQGNFLVIMEKAMLEEVKKYDLSPNVRIQTFGELAGEPDTEIQDPNALIEFYSEEWEYRHPGRVAVVLARLMGKPIPRGKNILVNPRSPKELQAMENQQIETITPIFREIERLSALSVIRLINEGVLPTNAINKMSPGYKRHQTVFAELLAG